MSLLPELPEHAARRPLIDELHARPFTPLSAPARVMHLAFLPEEDTEPPTNDEKTAHLAALLAHCGAPPPPPGLRNHFTDRVGDLLIKWERHTEFVSVTIIEENQEDEDLFSPTPLRRLPPGWLEQAPGKVICASLMEIRQSPSRAESEERLDTQLGPHFNRDGWACAFTTSGLSLSVCDFRRDPNGFVRMAILAEPALGPRRLGRISQRLLELETYRALAMLTLPVARAMGPKLSEIEEELETSARASAEAVDAGADREILENLTKAAAELESLAASAAFRFGAARAYDAIVNERIDVIREERARDRQTFREFMIRRFSPAMRTCWSTWDRLAALSARAERAANLLRTRVDVTLEAQNQDLLESMDRRAKLQLRLQQTVEGLSVVAISYYAVSLSGYVLAPIGNALNVSETLLKGLVALPVIAAVWFFVRRLRRHATDPKASDDAAGNAL